MPRNTVIDTATGGGAITLPFWVQQMNVVAQEFLIIGGVILLALRISLAFRTWTRQREFPPTETRLTMFQPATSEDIDTVARTIWGEARGEPIEGQQAVASVIGNRANIAAAWEAHHGVPHPLYGDGHLASACLAHHGGAYQFSVGTWQGLGFSGVPNQASSQTQDRAALALYAYDLRVTGNPWSAWETAPGCGLW